ncbi:MAG: carbohydrate binding domain-containing protein, partial [Cohnella sp.]|nr:carbohydrate binding domain-containing protein [Cohnella sp.]
LIIAGQSRIELTEGTVVKQLIVTPGANASTIEGKGKIEFVDNQATGVTFNGAPLQSTKSPVIPGGITPSTPNTNPGIEPSIDPASPAGTAPWTLVWSDEFENGTIGSNKWTYDLGNGQAVGNPGWGNNELEYYTSRTENVKEQDGKLYITARKEAEKYEGYDYTSARIKTKGLFAKTYGKFEIRAKAPTGKGLWPAIWMLPENTSEYGTWAASGEIDIMEGWGSRPHDIAGTIHYGQQWPGNTYSGKEYTFTDSTINDFHTYSLEWEPGELRWYVDGILFSTKNDWYGKSSANPANFAYPAPFDQPFHLLMNLAVGGNFDGNPTGETPFPSTMEVEYVRVYDLTGRPYREPVPIEYPKEDYLPGAKLPQGDDKDLVYNADYTQDRTGDAGMGIAGTAHWELFTGEGGQGSVSIDTIGDTRYAKVNIANGGNQPYSVQPKAIVSLAKGRHYKLSFEAKSDSARSMSVKLTGGESRGFVAYSQSLDANLTDGFKTYEMAFQMKQDSDNAARIEFNVGTNTKPVWIGNVKLLEIDGIPFEHDLPKTPLDNGNHLYNGTFDLGEQNRMSYWHVTTTGAAAATASVDAYDRQLKIDIANGGAAAADVKLLQKGTWLLHGHDYKVTFKAYSSSARTIAVAIASKDGSNAMQQGVNLAPGTQTVDVVLNGFAGSDDAEGQFQVLLGGAEGTIVLDNVQMVRTSAYIPDGVIFYPLSNGDFAGGLAGWESISDSGGSVAASVIAEEAKLTVANQGQNPWSAMLIQNGLQLTGGLTYVIRFDAKASIPRKMEVIGENGAYFRYFDETFDLGTSTQTYALEFPMPKNDTVGLKFLMGLLANTTALGQSHDVTIDNVVFEVKNAPVSKPPSLFADLTGNTLGSPIAITFPDNTAWRTAVTQVSINGTAIDSSKAVFSSGALTIAADAFSAAGNHVIQVKASGYADATVLQTILAGDGNLVVNGSFGSGPANWEAWSGEGGAATFTVENGAANIVIGAKGNTNWANQFFQAGIPMSAGRTYELQFTGSSTVNRPITVEFTGTSGGAKSFNLTSAATVFTTTFKVNDNAPLKLNYLIGDVTEGGATTPGGPHTITIDDVSIREVPTGHELLNGTFDTNADHWDLFNKPGEANASLAVTGGELNVDWASYDGFEIWGTQLTQNGLQLDAGKTYRLSFQIKSTIDKTIKLSVERGTDYNVQYLPAEDIPLTGGDGFVTVAKDFTIGAAAEPDGKVVLQMGGNHASAHTITIDNVTLIEVAPPPPSGRALQNGTFDTDTAGWMLYKSDGSNAVTSVDGGKLKIDFPDYDGWFQYSTQVYQEQLMLETDTTYVVSFEASSSIDKPISVEIARGGGGAHQAAKTFGLTSGAQTFTFEFTVTGTDQNAKLNFLLGSNNVPGENFITHSIWIDNVTLTEKTTD